MTERKIYDVLECKIGTEMSDRRIRFRTVADMRQAKDDLENDLDFEIKTKDKNGKMRIVSIPSKMIRRDYKDGKILFEAEEIE